MTCPLPAGCRFDGRSEILKARVLLHFTDILTGGSFTVPLNATFADVQQAQRRCRDRFTAAGSAFAPVATI